MIIGSSEALQLVTFSAVLKLYDLYFGTLVASDIFLALDVSYPVMFSIWTFAAWDVSLLGSFLFEIPSLNTSCSWDVLQECHRHRREKLVPARLFPFCPRQSVFPSTFGIPHDELLTGEGF